MSVYDGYDMIDTRFADYEAKATREATLRAQVRSLRELANDQAREIETLLARIADMELRVNDLEEAVGLMQEVVAA